MNYLPLEIRFIILDIYKENLTERMFKTNYDKLEILLKFPIKDFFNMRNCDYYDAICNYHTWDFFYYDNGSKCVNHYYSNESDSFTFNGQEWVATF